MRSHATPRALGVLFLAALPVLGTLPAGAQEQMESMKQLSDNYNTAVRSQLDQLRTGAKTVTAADKPAMDAAAKYFIYRFTTIPPLSADGMAKFRQEFDTWVDGTIKAKEPGPFIRGFGPVLVKRWHDLFDKDFQEYRYPIVNAAPTLASAAKLKDWTIGDYLTEVVKDHASVKGDKTPNKHNVLKLYAMRGLREYFPVTALETTAIVPTEDEKKKMEHHIRYVGALVEFVDRTEVRKGGDDDKKKEAPVTRSEEELGAIRYLRREAIESLAAAQAPVVLANKTKIEAPIAPTLLRILSPKSGLDPAPSLSERVEAAVGICQMKCFNFVDHYQPEVGVYLVGTLLGDFMTASNKDLIEAKNTRPPAMLWKVNAKRLEMALLKLKESVKNQPIQKQADKMADTAREMLKAMQGTKEVLQVDQTQLTQFRAQVNELKPKTTQIFKNVKTYSVEVE
jgi:hypothetical protein